MSNESPETWTSVLAERRLALGTSEATNATNEHDFRTQYKELCDANRERRGEQLLSRLQNKYENATTFVDDLDSVLDLQDETLASVFWSSLLGIIAVSTAFLEAIGHPQANF